MEYTPCDFVPNLKLYALIWQEATSVQSWHEHDGRNVMSFHWCVFLIADSKVHGANRGPIWGRQDPCRPHVGPKNFAIRDGTIWQWLSISLHTWPSTYYETLCWHNSRINIYINWLQVINPVYICLVTLRGLAINRYNADLKKVTQIIFLLRTITFHFHKHDDVIHIGRGNRLALLVFR